MLWVCVTPPLNPTPKPRNANSTHMKWAVLLGACVLGAGHLAASAKENVLAAVENDLWQRPKVVVVRNYLTMPKLGEGSDPGSLVSTASRAALAPLARALRI